MNVFIVCIYRTVIGAKPFALSYASSSSQLRLSKALNKSIVITPTFDPLFSLASEYYDSS